MTEKIDSFDKEFGFLSNFSPAHVSFGGINFPTVEHAYQAAKTFNWEDRNMIAALPTAGKAKKAGSKVTMRCDWDLAKLSVMRELLKQKFSIPKLKEQLLMTEDLELVEGNWWGDTFWGVCKGAGENHLGKLLMELRTELNGG